MATGLDGEGLDGEELKVLRQAAKQKTALALRLRRETTLPLKMDCGPFGDGQLR
jgi:hypothetical protein